MLVTPAKAGRVVRPWSFVVRKIAFANDQRLTTNDDDKF
jgi:hypothetical protein